MFEASRVINGVTMKTEDDTPIDKAKAEELLSVAIQLQGEFWDALTALEAALDGIEIDGSRDLSETTIKELMNDAQQDGNGTDGTGAELS
jgi:hypothetical protein